MAKLRWEIREFIWELEKDDDWENGFPFVCEMKERVYYHKFFFSRWQRSSGVAFPLSHFKDPEQVLDKLGFRF